MLFRRKTSNKKLQKYTANVTSEEDETPNDPDPKKQRGLLVCSLPETSCFAKHTVDNQIACNAPILHKKPVEGGDTEIVAQPEEEFREYIKRQMAMMRANQDIMIRYLKASEETKRNTVPAVPEPSIMLHLCNMTRK